MIKEFKKFIMRGNVIDMAVGIIIGAAFGKIVDSLVKDVLMPPLGLLIGKVDFSSLFVTLRAGAKNPGPYESLPAANAAGAITLNFGLFINNIVSFLIIAVAVFMLVKFVNKLSEKDTPAPEVKPANKTCPDCVSSIPLEAKRCPNCTSYIS